MAYRIRYGSGTFRREPRASSVRRRCLAALAMTVGMAVIRLSWQEGAQQLAQVFSREPVSAAEAAVYALGNALAAGEGWYHALAVWCRRIIDAGMA